MDIHKVCVNVLTLGYAEYVPIRLNASKTLLQNHKKRQTEQWHNFEKKQNGYWINNVVMYHSWLRDWNNATQLQEEPFY